MSHQATMLTDSTPPNDLIIAWAMPVNLAKLGARLAAYAETKATITTFRVVAGYKTQSTGRNLPEEIISMIASKIRDTVFKRKIELWVKTSQCLANTCTTLSHVPQAELNSLAAIVTSNKMEDDEWLAEEFAEEAHEAHRKKVRQYCHALTSPKNNSRIAKSIKIFAEDFGIHPYFVLQKFYEGCDYDDGGGFIVDQVQAKAFLTLPLQRMPISSEPAPTAAQFSVSSNLDPSALMGMTEHQRRQFTIAANVLKFRLYNAGGHAVVLENKSRMRDASRANEGTNSGELKNGDEDSDDTESDVVMSGGEDGPDLDAKSEKAESAQAESEEAESEGDSKEEESDNEESEEADPEEEGEWPQLMILGCGKLEAIQCQHY